VIKLTIPGKGKDRQKRDYTFSQLEDLQSRLMLVSGRSESASETGAENVKEVSVNRFTSV